MDVIKLTIRSITIALLPLFGGCEDFAGSENQVNANNLSDQLELFKGRMRPVEGFDKTFLTQNMERPKYPMGLLIQDRQIYTCEGGCNIMSVADGIVRRVFKKGWGVLILIQHGKYLTVYGQMGDASVDEGDRVVKGQSIGNAKPDFFFEIYKDKTKLNPAEWVKLRYNRSRI